MFDDAQESLRAQGLQPDERVLPEGGGGGGGGGGAAAAAAAEVQPNPQTVEELVGMGFPKDRCEYAVTVT